MDRHPGRELASRAGVDAGYVERLVGLGILTPGLDESFSVGDIRRVRLLKTLEQSGISLEGIGEAVARGHLSFGFLDFPVFSRFSGLSQTTFDDLSARTGVPVELLLSIREALGFARPNGDDLVRDDELEIVPAIELQLARGVSRPAIERLLRVSGESLRRVAETESDWFSSQFQMPRMEAGMNAWEAVEDGSRSACELGQPLERTLIGIYHAQQEHAMVRVLLENVESSLDGPGFGASRPALRPSVSSI